MAIEPQERYRRANALQGRSPPWRGLVERVLGVHTYILDAQRVHDAQQLLYRVYVVEQGWSPVLNNAAGIRVERDRLIDDQVHRSLWVGAYRNEVLVGTMRCVLADERGLEMTLYEDVPGTRNLAAVEFNRMALARSERGRGTYPAVYLTTLWALSKLDIERAFGSIPRRLLPLFETLGWSDTGYTLRYDPTDSEAAIVITLQWQPTRLLQAGVATSCLTLRRFVAARRS